jgi:hypothetical protein
MQDSGIPVKFNIPWGNSAGVTFINTIPQGSQIGVQAGRASLTDGFPPTTFQPVAAGGVPPFGGDMNGILKQITQWAQWYSAGGPIGWDSAFSAAVGGYPKGAIVASVTTFGLFWYCLADNNSSNPDSAGANWLGFQLAQTSPATGGQLNFATGTSITLNPVAGGLLWISGLNYAIPSAGVSLTNAGLSGSTLYYVYAFMSGSTMVLEASTTAYAIASNGIPQKIGDATRTLVGMAYINNVTQFSNTDGSLFTRTYFNRFIKRSRSQFSVDRTVTSTAFIEINSEIRNSFLVWSGENVNFDTAGSFGIGTANAVAVSRISFDGAAAEQEACIASGATVGGGGGNSATVALSGVKIGLSEGLHFATLFGAVSTNTGTWNSANTNTTGQTTLSVTVGT